MGSIARVVNEDLRSRILAATRNGLSAASCGIGRIDMKAERKEGVLDVKKLWLEPGVRAATGRLEKLDAELRRLAKFTGVQEVRYRDGWV